MCTIPMFTADPEGEWAAADRAEGAGQRQSFSLAQHKLMGGPPWPPLRELKFASSVWVLVLGL
jgi:hypothetical protein